MTDLHRFEPAQNPSLCVTNSDFFVSLYFCGFYIFLLLYYQAGACPGLVGDSPPCQALSCPLTNPSLPHGLTPAGKHQLLAIEIQLWNRTKVESLLLQNPDVQGIIHTPQAVVGHHSVRHKSQAGLKFFQRRDLHFKMIQFDTSTSQTDMKRCIYWLFLISFTF